MPRRSCACRSASSDRASAWPRFPFLAQLYSEGKLDELNRLLNSTLKGLIAVARAHLRARPSPKARPSSILVFSHTRLRPPDLDATAATLVFFSLGMFGWGAQYILARGFYATRNTLVPAIVGTVLTFANLPVYWLLVRRYQHLGLAWPAPSASRSTP